MESLEDWRIKELKNFDIDFTKGFNFNYVEFKDFDFSPLFKDGILFSSDNDKGDLFHEFLKHLPQHPSFVVFVDDRIENVESMRRACINNNIEFLGFHYIFDDIATDIDIINSQLDYLIKYKKWISEKNIILPGKNIIIPSINSKI